MIDDPDAPNGDWVHFLACNINPDKNITKDSLINAIIGRNSWGKTEYDLDRYLS